MMGAAAGCMMALTRRDQLPPARCTPCRRAEREPAVKRHRHRFATDAPEDADEGPPVVIYNGSAQECPICLERYDDGQQRPAAVTSCGHMACARCLLHLLAVEKRKKCHRARSGEGAELAGDGGDAVVGRCHACRADVELATIRLKNGAPLALFID